MSESAAPLRWGIIGLGGIAHAFARDLPRARNARLYAVASRAKRHAETFGHSYGVATERCYGSYADLIADPQVQAVYIATPHPMHFENARLCLEAGKAVLCEKSLTINAREAQILADTARARGVPLLEAMWTRWLPATLKLRELVASGAIGEVRMVQASFGIRIPYDPEHRLFKPELGGGALLDLGVYPVSFASMLLGTPSSVQAAGSLAPSGVDEQVGLLLGHAGGALALLSCGSRTLTDQRAWVYGTEGFIVAGPEFFHPRTLTLQRPGQPPQTFELPFEGGYQYEADELGRMLREGRVESEALPLAESVAVMHTLDQARAQLGVRYPGEAAP